MAGANTARDSPSRLKSSMPGRSMALPIWVQWMRSVEWWIGRPGNQAKVELTR